MLPGGLAAVYPRASGGTRTRSRPQPSRSGLSPRERGNQPFEEPLQDGVRSIPARAGEPPRNCGRARRTPVYPRASGGTFSTREHGSMRAGLSPRERGNRRRPKQGQHLAGSIPARAGEPKLVMGATPGERVYPRASGGTAVTGDPDDVFTGLSPRERGNRHLGGPRHDAGGSIPARAGEPPAAGSAGGGVAVYPRASGGTPVSMAGYDSVTGLSPRERGNRLQERRDQVGGRSIPARAGEPIGFYWRRSLRAVYPRASGGTTQSAVALSNPMGLSPRERGNHPRRHARGCRGGSIPARAGEPLKKHFPAEGALQDHSERQSQVRLGADSSPRDDVRG